MARIRSVAVIAPLALCGGSLVRSRVGDEHSVQQVVETLRNLRESLEDSAKRAEASEAQVAEACKEALRRTGDRAGENFSGPNASSLRSSLKEQEADLERSEGRVKQVSAGISLAERARVGFVQAGLRSSNATLTAFFMALPSTNSDASLVASVGSNKQMMLASMRGALEVLVPSVAQLRERKTETARRLEARIRSVASSGRFLAAIRDSCAQSSTWSSARSTSLANEQNYIAAAEAALQQIAPDAAEVSFAQLSEVRRHTTRRGADDGDESPEERVEDVFASQPGEDQQTQAERKDSDDSLDTVLPSKGASEQGTEGEASAQKVEVPAEARPMVENKKGPSSAVRELLSEVKGSAEKDDHTWCTKERLRTKLALHLAEDVATELGKEVDERAQMETQIARDLTVLSGASSAVAAASKDVSGGLAKQKELLSSRAQELALAKRIMEQAVHVLSDLRSAGALPSAAGAAGGVVDAAVDSLKQVDTFLADEAKSQSGALDELTRSMKVLAQTASECSSDLKAEHVQLDFARQMHASARARLAESRRRYDDDWKDVETYAADLEKTCGQDIAHVAAQETAAEARALEDAEVVLAGKDLPERADAAGASGLRGAGSVAHRPVAAAKLQDLSPLERAAQEMGVSTD